MDATLYKTLLFDFYGDLLQERPRRIFEMYHLEDMSLSEVADSIGISRQGVRDSINRSLKTLEEYEECMCLVEEYFLNKNAKEYFCEQITNVLSGIKVCAEGQKCPLKTDAVELLTELKAYLED